MKALLWLISELSEMDKLSRMVSEKDGGKKETF